MKKGLRLLFHLLNEAMFDEDLRIDLIMKGLSAEGFRDVKIK
jgi:hypothetical protein